MSDHEAKARETVHGFALSDGARETLVRYIVRDLAAAEREAIERAANACLAWATHEAGMTVVGEAAMIRNYTACETAERMASMIRALAQQEGGRE